MTRKNRRLAAGWTTGVLALALVSCSTDPEIAKREYVKSGDRYVERHKYREAVVQYRNALQRDARFGEARYKLAETYEKLGDLPNSYREHIRAADALPDDVQAQVKAGAYLLAAGQFEDARTRAQKALKKDAKNADAQVLLGNSLAGLKDFAAAIRELEEAVRLDPKSASAYASLGTAQVESGAKADAEQAFRKAVETNPKMPMAHLALANYLWSTGNRPGAEASLKDALALDPKNPLARRALATLYLFSNRGAEAEPHLKALADADTSASSPLKLALADYYIRMNRVDDGLKVLEGLATQSGSAAAAKTRLAVIDMARKDPVSARKTIDEVLQKDPKNVPALLVKAQFLIGERKLDEALAAAKLAVAADPLSVPAQYLTGSIQRASNRPDDAIAAFTEVLKVNPRAVAAQVQLAQLTLAKGQADTSMQFAQDAAKALPNDPLVQLTLVRSMMAKGQLVRAEKIIRDLAAKYPQAAAVHSAMGRVVVAKGDFKGARAEFAKAAALDPNDFDAVAGLTLLDLRDKKADPARARIEAYMAKQPDSIPALVLSSRVYWVAGDQAKSEAALRKAIDLNPNDLNTYNLLGQVYAAQKRLPQARSALEEIVKKNPKAVAPHTVIAMLYEMEGDKTSARQRYERVLQIEPNAAVASNNLAYLYADGGGNLDLALQLAQTAMQKLPDSPEVSDTVGWIYVKKGLPALGIPMLEAAAIKAPANATVQFHLAEAYLKSGQKIKAKQVLDKIARLNVDPALAKEIQKARAEL